MSPFPSSLLPSPFPLYMHTGRATAPQMRFRIRGEAATSSGIIEIRDVIGIPKDWGGAGTDQEFADSLRALGDVQTLDIRINSAGGDVFTGLSIVRQLLDHPAKKIGTVEGLAASMASYILMACDVRRIPANAYVMVHKPWGVMIGNEDEIRAQLAELSQLTENFIAAYAQRAGKDIPAIAALFEGQGTMMDGRAAIEQKFADELLSDVEPGVFAAIDSSALPAPLTAHLSTISGSAATASAPPAAPSAAAPTQASQPPTGLWARIRTLFGSTAPADPAADLRAQIAALTLERDTARQELTDRDQRLSALQADLTELTAIRAQVAQLETERQTVAAAASTAAVEIVAAAGFTPAREQTLPTAATTGDIVAEFNALPPEQRSAFFQKNKAKLLAARDRITATRALAA